MLIERGWNFPAGVALFGTTSFHPASDVRLAACLSPVSGFRILFLCVFASLR
jgi:hypothetical protein